VHRRQAARAEMLPLVPHAVEGCAEVGSRNSGVQPMSKELLPSLGEDLQQTRYCTLSGVPCARVEVYSLGPNSITLTSRAARPVPFSDQELERYFDSI